MTNGPIFQGSRPASSSMYAGEQAGGYAAGSFHIHTQLPDGRQSILVDPGSVGNLCGDKWARNVARMAHRNGMKPLYEERDTPLKVSGVGNEHQECHFDCKLPIALKPEEGNSAILGESKH